MPHLCNYTKIKKLLTNNNFKNLEDNFVNVWKK